MKKLLAAALVSCAMLWSAAGVQARIVNPAARVVDVYLSGWDLIATSETTDGPIVQIEVRKVTLRNPTIVQGCDSYSCQVDVSGLSSGTYEVKVICTNTVYYEQFTK